MRRDVQRVRIHRAATAVRFFFVVVAIDFPASGGAREQVRKRRLRRLPRRSSPSSPPLLLRLVPLDDRRERHLPLIHRLWSLDVRRRRLVLARPFRDDDVGVVGAGGGRLGEDRGIGRNGRNGPPGSHRRRLPRRRRRVRRRRSHRPRLSRFLPRDIASVVAVVVVVAVLSKVHPFAGPFLELRARRRARRLARLPPFPLPVLPLAFRSFLRGEQPVRVLVLDVHAGPEVIVVPPPLFPNAAVAVELAAVRVIRVAARPRLLREVPPQPAVAAQDVLQPLAVQSERPLLLLRGVHSSSSVKLRRGSLPRDSRRLRRRRLRVVVEPAQRVREDLLLAHGSVHGVHEQVAHRGAGTAGGGVLDGFEATSRAVRVESAQIAAFHQRSHERLASFRLEFDLGGVRLRLGVERDGPSHRPFGKVGDVGRRRRRTSLGDGHRVEAIDREHSRPRARGAAGDDVGSGDGPRIVLRARDVLHRGGADRRRGRVEGSNPVRVG